MEHTSRRRFIVASGVSLAAGLVLGHPARASARPLIRARKFEISLAQWSLHRALFAGQLKHLDFPQAAKKDYGIEAVEYVNSFFEKKNDGAYNKELRKRCDDLGVRSLLIMCDGEGAIGDPDEKKRAQAVENHRKWVEAAKALGCHSIRVNAQSSGAFEEQQRLAADGLRKLCELADPMDVNVIVENHGGLSSSGAWLAGVMKLTSHKRVGTLPDFGNFRVSDKEEYDRYKGVGELMPFAKGVSAKSYDFNDKGDETKIDYPKMLKVVLDAGYTGHIGIEYEGGRLSEPEGIRATKALLERIRDTKP
jgi:L-ribulose-5-phosphate 3-epimerase